MSQTQDNDRNFSGKPHEAGDKAASGFLYTLPFPLLLLTVIIMCTRPVMDADIWFHLAYGKYILTNKTLILDHRIFTWTPASNDIVYCQWLAQAFLYVCYEMGGRAFLFAVRYATFLTYLMLLYFYIRRHDLAHQPTAWLIAFLSLIISSSAIIIKPNMFSCIFMQLFVLIWFQLKTATGKDVCWCYAYPVLTIFWVNTHGVWIFGLAYLCVIGAGEIMNMVFSPDKALNPIIRKHFFVAVILSALATLVNPYGWVYPFQVVESMFSAEFKTHFATNLDYVSLYTMIRVFGGLTEYNTLFLLIVSVFIFLMLFRHQIKSRSLDWTILLPFLLFAFLYVYISRTMFLYASVFAFSSFYLLCRRQVAGIWTPAGTTFSRVLLFFLFAGMLVYFNALNIYSGGDWLGFGTVDDAPIEETGFLKDHFHGPRIGNDYESGSYLSWMLWPQVKTAIDSRYFPFEAWYPEYIRFIQGVDVNRFLEKFACDLWCIGLDKPVINYFLQAPDWVLIFYGSWDAVFIKKGSDLIDVREKTVSTSILKIKNTRRLLQLIRFAQRVGDFHVALDLIENARLIKGRSQLKSRLYASLAGEKFKAGDWAGASLLFSRALEEDPDNIDGLYGLGVSRFAVGDLSSAERHLGSVRKMNANYKEANQYLDRVLNQKRQVQESIRNISESLRHNPGNADLYCQLGLLHEMNGDSEKAEAHYQKALAIDPDSLGVLNSLACLGVKKKQYAHAVEYYAKMFSLQPDSPSAGKICYNIGCLYSLQGEEDKSVYWLKRAVEKGYDNWNQIKTDSDLNNIRGSAEYQDLVRCSDDR
ncbi:MAG: tetratricopeptide repeat protein [Thermodesulfobacteriota bacterium]